MKQSLRHEKKNEQKKLTKILLPKSIFFKFFCCICCCFFWLVVVVIVVGCFMSISSSFSFFLFYYASPLFIIVPSHSLSCSDLSKKNNKIISNTNKELFHPVEMLFHFFSFLVILFPSRKSFSFVM